MWHQLGLGVAPDSGEELSPKFEALFAPPRQPTRGAVFFQYVYLTESGSMVHRFGWMATPQRMFSLITLTKQKHRTFFETIMDREYHGNRGYGGDQAPRFDIDILIPAELNSETGQYEPAGLISPEMVVNALLFAILDYSAVHNMGIDTQQIRIYSSHGITKKNDSIYCKYSYHIIIRGWKHATAADAASFYNEIIARVKRLEPGCAGWIDHSVYAKFQQFRMLFCTKPGSGRWKTRITQWKLGDTILTWPVLSPEEDFLDSLVTNCPVTDREVPLPPPVEVQGLMVAGFGGLDLASRAYSMLAEKWPEFAISYHYPERSGDVWRLNRERPGYCGVCQRTHESENALMKIEEPIFGGLCMVHFFCFRHRVWRLVGLIGNDDAISPSPTEEAKGGEREPPKLNSIQFEMEQVFKKQMPKVFAACRLEEANGIAMTYRVTREYECPIYAWIEKWKLSDFDRSERANTDTAAKHSTGTITLVVRGKYQLVQFDCGHQHYKHRQINLRELLPNFDKMAPPLKYDEVYTTADGYLKPFTDELLRNGMVGIGSPKGTGKSDTTRHVARELHDRGYVKRILVPLPYQSLVRDGGRKWRKSFPMMQTYLELTSRREMREADMLIITPESLRHLRIPSHIASQSVTPDKPGIQIVRPYDLVYLDEAVISLFQFTSKTMSYLGESFEVFEYVIRTARYVVCTDGGMTSLVKEVMDKWRPKPMYTLLNASEPPKRTIYYFHREQFLSEITATLINQGLKVFCPTSTRAAQVRLIEGVRAILETGNLPLVRSYREKLDSTKRDTIEKYRKYGPRHYLAYSSLSEKEERETLDDVVSAWGDSSVAMIAATPTVGPGTDFYLTDEDLRAGRTKVDVLIGAYDNRGAMPRYHDQAHYRVRQLASSIGFLYIDPTVRSPYFHIPRGIRDDHKGAQKVYRDLAAEVNRIVAEHSTVEDLGSLTSGSGGEVSEELVKIFAASSVERYFASYYPKETVLYFLQKSGCELREINPDDQSTWPEFLRAIPGGILRYPEDTPTLERKEVGTSDYDSIPDLHDVDPSLIDPDWERDRELGYYIAGLHKSTRYLNAHIIEVMRRRDRLSPDIANMRSKYIFQGFFVPGLFSTPEHGELVRLLWKIWNDKNNRWRLYIYSHLKKHRDYLGEMIRYLSAHPQDKIKRSETIKLRRIDLFHKLLGILGRNPETFTEEYHGDIAMFDTLSQFLSVHVDQIRELFDTRSKFDPKKNDTREARIRFITSAIDAILGCVFKANLVRVRVGGGKQIAELRGFVISPVPAWEYYAEGSNPIILGGVVFARDIAIKSSVRGWMLGICRICNKHKIVAPPGNIETGRCSGCIGILDSCKHVGCTNKPQTDDEVIMGRCQDHLKGALFAYGFPEELLTTDSDLPEERI